MAKAGVGVPVKLLHETEGHIITVEMKSGLLFLMSKLYSAT